MIKVPCVSPSGEYFELFRDEGGIYLCPVCGSAEFDEPPYDTDGNPSFQMCSCKFEFGFDDSPLASEEAVEGLEANWNRWRLGVIEQTQNSPSELRTLEENLSNIGYQLAYDLIPVKKTSFK